MQYAKSIWILCIGLELIIIQTTLAAYVRLRDGLTPYEGRVEVFRNGTWDSICSRGWDLKDAEVACRQLGYWRGAMFTRIGQNGRSRSKYMLSNIACTGLETAVQDCHHKNVLTSNDYSTIEEEECPATLAAGVTCNVPGYQGCFNHLSNALALRRVCTSDSSITVNVCAAYCRRKGYAYSGVTHGQECCCDNQDPRTFSEKRTNNWDCALPCAGDNSQACGGNLYIAIYKSEIGSCGAVYTSRSGYITSPAFPSTLSFDSACQWTIKAHVTTVIHLKFEMFQLGPSDNMTLTTKMNRRLILEGNQFQGVIPVIDPVVTSELVVELNTGQTDIYLQRGFVMHFKTNSGTEAIPSQLPSLNPGQVQTTSHYNDDIYPDNMHPGGLFSKDRMGKIGKIRWNYSSGSPSITILAQSRTSA
ncbi:deleted in malignant brain tumors 1 protein-like isoform X2 [Anneissia japonica]|uniref:deleted in malignant brain tumors 1 protein-like isoform X2 n=1 Tax=Anneissia japonica TaxID=1529436 RepID=UPI0014255ACC|nr:deleted in malignant brain tumors 1 protein-like isoform X2 [Anneissia japonica]